MVSKFSKNINNSSRSQKFDFKFDKITDDLKYAFYIQWNVGIAVVNTKLRKIQILNYTGSSFESLKNSRVSAQLYLKSMYLFITENRLAYLNYKTMKIFPLNYIYSDGTANPSQIISLENQGFLVKLVDPDRNANNYN
jgi:hypothetical protein